MNSGNVAVVKLDWRQKGSTVSSFLKMSHPATLLASTEWHCPFQNIVILGSREYDIISG